MDSITDLVFLRFWTGTNMRSRVFGVDGGVGGGGNQCRHQRERDKEVHVLKFFEIA